MSAKTGSHRSSASGFNEWQHRLCQNALYAIPSVYHTGGSRQKWL